MVIQPIAFHHVGPGVDTEENEDKGKGCNYPHDGDSPWAIASERHDEGKLMSVSIWFPALTRSRIEVNKWIYIVGVSYSVLTYLRLSKF